MRTLALATALFATVMLAAAPSQNPDELLKQAKVAISQHEGDRAVELLEKAIEIKPNNAELHYWLSSAYATVGESAGAFKKMSAAKNVIAELERAVEIDPNHLEARLDLVSYYSMAPGFMGGGEDKALAQAAEVKKRDAFKGHRAYARAYIAQKKLDLARNEYVTAVREEPNAARSHAAFGAFLSNHDKNYKSAFQELEKAVQLDAAYMPGWYRLGEAVAKSGMNYARGEEALKKYLAYQPKDDEPQLADAHYLLGQIYEKQGKKADARQNYAAALRLSPGTKTYEEGLKRVS